MITCPTIEKRQIRNHYDLATVFYRLLWGRHIHHGLWEADESPKVAQLKLTETLADLAGIKAGEKVLDVGCGMGGSSIHLARSRRCDVMGITLSPVQRLWAKWAAARHGVARRTRFERLDAEQAEFSQGSFDVVWCIECTEHLFDKPLFFEKAAGWLAPGGRIALCAWLAGDRQDEEARRQVYDVCEGFLCPSLGTQADYVAWIEATGLKIEHSFDWTARVQKTWEICRRRVERSGVRWIARLLDRNMVTFLDRFDVILRAYASGAMRYGCFVAYR